MNPQTPKDKNSKGGRPKKPENELRLYPVKVYFDEANHRKLMNRSRRTGQPLSTIVYDLAINGYVREPFTKDEVSMLRSLSGMANNLNQLARQANTYGFHQMAIDVGNVAKKVDDLLIRFSEK
ncbi:MAG: plasmid mobilization relaxosome protein MobC [Prevotella sp.]|jgi:hypothetical protein|nr:plasmid mobilization relaxosome protein MobC [Prevotella sp.]